VFLSIQLSHASDLWKLKEKKKKRNINIDLAILPSYDTTPSQGSLS